MASGDVILAGEDLHKTFGRGSAGVEVLRGLDLEIRRGDFLAVMGPSGCGKSTLLHVLGLMTQPDAGLVRLDGERVGGFGEAEDGSIAPAGPVASERRRTLLRRTKLGFVFQRFNLLGVLTGRDNIRLSLKIRGIRDCGHVEPLLESMGVAEAAGRKPGNLSIGEQQRLAVARALAGRPELLLADEPTGSLDTENRAALLDVLRGANEDRGQTIVMITHSAGVAASAGRIAYMRDGKILDGDA